MVLTTIQKGQAAAIAQNLLARSQQEDGKRSLVLLLLEQRVGQLPDSVRDRISQLNLAELEALAIALLNFSTLAELKAWLESYQ